MRLRNYILCSVLFLAVSVLAQQQETLVYLEHCETLSFDEQQHPDAQILRGDVRFRHEDALMYCDSAYFYEKNNSLDAFGHIRLVQGDTLMGYGDILYYNGNTKIARFRKHVKLVHKETILTTDSLNYNRAENIAYYFTGGQIKDSVNTLTSRWGQYTPPTHQALFKTKVHLENDNFTLDADTLLYNTETNITNLVGPTEIIYQNETNIYASLGWYNTRTEESELLRDARIEHTNGKTLLGDTIFYNKKIGYGRVKQQMTFTDSTRNASLLGNYGELWEDGKHGYATDSAVFKEYSGDTLYIHADTLFTEEIPYRVFTLQKRDSIMIDSVLTYQAPDTLWRDTAYQRVRAFYKTRLYRSDIQAKCDSAVYNFRDSIMMLYTNPICWSDEQQISADSIHIFMKDSTVDYAHGMGKAMIVIQESPIYYNQLSGKELFAYIRAGELREIQVDGNAETVFYPQEDDGTFIGVNKTQSSNVRLYFHEQKIEHILFTTHTTGVMYPLDSISPESANLTNFFWAEQERPKSPENIFDRPDQVERPQETALSAAVTEKTAENEDKPEAKDRKRSHKQTQEKSAVSNAQSAESVTKKGGRTTTNNKLKR